MKKCLLIILSVMIAQTAAAEADTVTLNYNWEAGMIARVKYESSKIRLIQGKERKREITGSYLLSTETHEKGLKLDFSDHKTDVKSSRPGEKNKIEGFLQRLSEISPSFIIAPNGELVEVVDLTKLKDEMQREINAWFADGPPEIKQEMNRLLRDFLSEQQLLAQIQRGWNRDVGQWIGAEFETGYVYDIEFSTPVPFLNNEQIPTRGEYKYLGKIKCRSNDQDKKCVELNFRSFLDEKATQEVIGEIVGKMGGKAPPSFQVKINYEVQVVTEYETLRPHMIMETKIITAPIQGGSASAVQTDTKKISYTYQPQ